MGASLVHGDMLRDRRVPYGRFRILSVVGKVKKKSSRPCPIPASSPSEPTPIPASKDSKAHGTGGYDVFDGQMGEVVMWDTWAYYDWRTTCTK